MIRRLLPVLFLLIICCGAAACGSVETTSSSVAREPVSLYTLQTSMLEAGKSLPDMTTVSSSNDNAEDLFSYLSDFDYDKVDGYFLAYSSEGLADEIAVVRLKSKSDIAGMIATLEDHVDGRRKLYESYQPDQVNRVENALVFSQDNYAVLIIGNDQQVIKEAFEEIINT